MKYIGFGQMVWFSLSQFPPFPCFGVRTNKIVFAADISKDAMGPMPTCGTGPPETSQLHWAQLWAPLGGNDLEDEICTKVLRHFKKLF